MASVYGEWSGFHSDVAVLIFYRSELMFSCKYILFLIFHRQTVGPVVLEALCLYAITSSPFIIYILSTPYFQP